MKKDIQNYFISQVNSKTVPPIPSLKKKNKKENMKPWEGVLIAACTLLFMFLIYIPQIDSSRENRFVMEKQHREMIKNNITGIFMSYSQYNKDKGV